MKDSKKYATYLRVSTQRQGATGLGLSAQRKMCADYIASKKGTHAKEFMDVESGTHRDRAGLWNAIDYCRTNNCELVIAKLDRLARDIEFTFKIINTGIAIHFTDMPMVNTMVLGVFASVAQYERELVSSRTKQALAVKKSQGAQLGASNPTYKLNRQLKDKDLLKRQDMKKGMTKNERFLQSRDTQALFKILRRVFPDACEKENPAEWRWDKIGTKKECRAQIFEMMRDFKDMDSEGKLFVRWNMDADDLALQQKLSSTLYSVKRSLTTKATRVVA